MQAITPPPRRRELDATDPNTHGSATKVSDPTFSTPNARDSRMFPWNSGDDKTISIFPAAGAIPATPQTTLESNDGSTIKTPFANFASWNGGSPDIVMSPTPSGMRSEKDVLQMIPPMGSGFDYATPQYPPDLASFASGRHVPESPLASKARPSKSKLQQGNSVAPERALSRSTTPEEVVIKPLILSSEIHSPMQEATPDTRGEDAHSASIKDMETSPVVAVEEDEQLDDTTSLSAAVESPKKNPVEIPASIRRWLEAPSPIKAARKSTTSIGREERDEKMRRRLAAFMRVQAVPLQSDPTDHPRLGRVLGPTTNSKEDNPIVPGWPDDAYPWVQPSLQNSGHDLEQMRKLKMIANYLDSSSDTEEEAQVPTGQSDPADAVTVFRNKRTSRRWLQKCRSTPFQRPRTHTTVTPEDPVEEEVSNEMDVDKSGTTDCICHGEDDGREMVQCDNCQTWSHIECVTKDAENLPEKWFCYKCPDITIIEKDSEATEPTFSVVDSPVKNRYSTSANAPLYQAPESSNRSPRRNSHPQSQMTSSSLFEAGRASIFGDGSPSPLHGGFSRFTYGVWPEGAGPSADKLDDPITAMAATPFSGFIHEDSTLDELNSSPSRHLGFRFTPVFASTPKKERPWTNYTGTFATPTNPSGSQFSSFTNQPLPAVPTDPLFIHYEHDAPKQTAHHHGSPAKKKRKGKNRGQEKSEEKSDPSAPDASRSEVAEGTNETSASEPPGDTPPPSAGEPGDQEAVDIKIEV